MSWAGGKWQALGLIQSGLWDVEVAAPSLISSRLHLTLPLSCPNAFRGPWVPIKQTPDVPVGIPGLPNWLSYLEFRFLYDSQELDGS